MHISCRKLPLASVLLQVHNCLSHPDLKHVLFNSQNDGELAEMGSSSPAILISPQHDDMAPLEATMLVELSKEG